jgi:predicted ATPase
MIKQVKIKYFKRFEEESFEMSDSIILAGPNNTGKSTLLQAISVWYLVLKKWLSERGPESGSKAQKRLGVAITRQDFTAIPIREMNLLWTNRSTGLRKHELKQGQQLGTPRILEIGIEGTSIKGDWQLNFEFTYRYPELIHVKPTTIPDQSVIDTVKGLNVVHVPPFSGIGSEETRYDKAYQELLIGQGKPGDVLRNLLLEVYEKEDKSEWQQLGSAIENTFGYRLLPPSYGNQPYIVCEYQPGIPEKMNSKELPRLDISCAGGGFLQLLMMFGFIYARPTSILLLDEPDAHLHIILQRQMYDDLRRIARDRGSQLLIATHSEVIVENTAPEQILSFFEHPHILLNTSQRDQVHEALKNLTSLDILLAEQSQGILYIEGETDLNLLREWAKILRHPVYDFLAHNPFWHSNKGRHPREARSHYFALKAVHPEIRGLLLLDGDNRKLPDHELTSEGLSITRWKRYEAENYLVNPPALLRFIESGEPDFFSTDSATRGFEYLKKQLPPGVFENPLIESDYLNSIPASKTLLPGFFAAAEINLTKNEYYQIVAKMKGEEIPFEVKEKLDLISKVFGLGTNSVIQS